MIQSLQFIKTKHIQETINHALQTVGSNKNKKNKKNKPNVDPKQKLQTIKAADYISLEDAQFIVNLLNEDHSHNHKHYVHEMLSGSTIYKPPPKMSKNPKFEQYLKQLRKKQAQKDYEKLINYNKPSAHQKSVLSTIKSERGIQQWLDYTSIGHLIMIMVGSFLVFFYLAHHIWPHQKEYKIVAGCIGLLFGLIVEFALMVVKEQKAELEAKSKNPNINMEKNHIIYNEKSIQKVIDAQKQRKEQNKMENKSDTKNKKS